MVRPRKPVSEKRLTGKLRAQRFRAKLVNLGDQAERWNYIKAIVGVDNDSLVAKILIDNFLENCDDPSVALMSGLPAGASMPKGETIQLPSDNGASSCDEEKQDNVVCDKADDMEETFFVQLASTDAIKVEVEDCDYTGTATSTLQLGTREEVKSCTYSCASDTNLEEETFSDDPHDVDEIVNFYKNEDQIIKVEVEKENEESDDNRRSSRRIKSRGFRPNYAALEWKEDIDSCASSESELVPEDECGEIEDKQEDSLEYSAEYVEKDVRGKEKSVIDNEEMAVKSNQSVKCKVRGKVKKKQIEADPDFCISDEDIGKETGEIKTKVEKKSSPKMKYRKRQLSETSSGGETRKVEKKSKVAIPREKVEKLTNKKVWVFIKLDEHTDKFEITTVDSFERKNRKANVVQDLFSCLVCNNFKCAERDSFETHIENHINEVFDCRQCSYIGYSKYDIRNHRKNYGHTGTTGTGRYVCDICGTVLNTKPDKLRHLGTVHGMSVPDLKCNFCSEMFDGHFNRKKHMRNTHREEYRFCLGCHKVFPSLSIEAYNEHCLKCKKSQQCQKCGKMLSSAISLYYHMVRHRGVRVFKCHLCAYEGNGTKKLRNHIASHTKNHSHSCDQCPFTCVQPYQLTSHMRTHTGEKPYKCTQCKYAAAWNVQLKEHVKVHSMETNVTCQQCDVVFKNDKTLNIHFKKHDNYSSI